MPEHADPSLLVETHEPPMPLAARVRLILSGLGIVAAGLFGVYAGWNALSAPVVTPDDRVLATFMLCAGVAVAPAGAGLLWWSVTDHRTQLRIDGRARTLTIRRSHRRLWSSRIVQSPEQIAPFSDICGIEAQRARGTRHLYLLTPHFVEPLGTLDRWPELGAAADQLVAMARAQERSGNAAVTRTKRHRMRARRRWLLGGLIVGTLLCLITWAIFELVAGPAVP